jgi:hypothetical protein
MKIQTNRPTEKIMLRLIGAKAPLWSELRDYLAAHYGGHVPVLSVGKKEYDWTIRYRKGGKTLVTLLPEKNNFCVLVVLGREEVARARDMALNPTVKKILATAKQYHDGRWLWIRPGNRKDVESVKALLIVKRKPQRET